MTADDYVNRVLDWMPRGTPRRDQIGTELRGHISERVASGRPLPDVLQQLGDPAALAISYLAEIPLTAAPLGRRILAKVIDLLLVCVLIAVLCLPLVYIASTNERFQLLPVVFLLTLIGGSLLFALYTVLAEWSRGQTLGKYVTDLRVVQESGARISFGQSIVRQLPAPLQVYWIDACFALFTDKSQRAFEMLSKTRTVVAG